MNWKKRFVSQKLNVKFTLVIILFMVIPIGILAGILFYNMEKNVVSENTGYMEYTMEQQQRCRCNQDQFHQHVHTVFPER